LASTRALRAAVTGEVALTASIDDDEGWHRHARTALSSYYHPTSTCAIGRVVDRDARVIGLDNVYVGDASVMPTIPRANTNLSTLAVAERVADLLREARIVDRDRYSTAISPVALSFLPSPVRSSLAPSWTV
jgi:choline dehydrogenase